MGTFIKYNYHTHTYRCGHATGTEREYIEKAILMGIKTLGFSDHIPFDSDVEFVKKVRMEFDEAYGYVQTIRKLADEYKDEIRILVGFEAEYSRFHYHKQAAFVEKLGCDYMIMGQHFITDDRGNPIIIPPTDDEKILVRYINTMIEGAETGSYTYIAHPDFIRFTGSQEIYKREYRRFCKEMKRLAVPLEINMLGMRERRNYPNPLFWEIVGELGNPVIIGMDAHNADSVGDTATYEKCIELANTYQLKLVEKII